MVVLREGRRRRARIVGRKEGGWMKGWREERREGGKEKREG